MSMKRIMEKDVRDEITVNEDLNLLENSKCDNLPL
jgi:hypothetical protein